MRATDGIRTAIGLMSGTSADGIDAAIIETDGISLRSTGAFVTHPYPPETRSAILVLAGEPERAGLDPLIELEQAITEAHAEAVRAVLAVAGLEASAIDVVGFHGQTVLHRPQYRFTRQLGDGAALAAMIGIPVVNRFRHADIAAGGQGAPLVPVFHAALVRGIEGPLAVLNLGGVGNVTFIDGDTILAFDTGPGNALIDDWVRSQTGAFYDEGGSLAARGRVDELRLAALLAHPFFDAVPPKSLDRNSFAVDMLAGLSLEDGAATLAAFTVASVARAREHLPQAPMRWLVAGGGRHNAKLMAGLQHALQVPVDPVEAVGWDGDALEAQAFGFLAVRTLDGLPLSLPTTTGVPHPMPGGVRHDVRRS
jgi:anhydro-N-acetylmuramic acid kinase